MLVSYIPAASEPLCALAKVNQDLIGTLGRRCAEQRNATVDLDATIIESAKREAKPTYEGGTGYRPLLALCAGDGSGVGRRVSRGQCAGAVNSAGVDVARFSGAAGDDRGVLLSLRLVALGARIAELAARQAARRGTARCDYFCGQRAHDGQTEEAHRATVTVAVEVVPGGLQC